MNCSGAQNQMTYSDTNADMMGQNTLADVLSHSYTTPTNGGTGTAVQNGGASQLLGPYAPSGGTTIQQAPSGVSPSLLLPITPMTEPVPMNVNNLQYLNAALRTQIGRKVTIDFLIGTNTLVDKTGTLLAVGANYLIINELETDDITFCDFFTIKFVKAYR